MAWSIVSAGAQDVVGFRSPSGNIHCQFFTVDHEPTIRCDLAQSAACQRNRSVAGGSAIPVGVATQVSPGLTG